MKYYIIAGEASGDLHGSNLIKEILQQDSQANIRCWGGDKMQDTGATLVKHYRDLAFMGFVEVIKHLGTILKNITFCKKDVIDFAPDVLVLIDYPGFNLRIAQWARANKIKVAYYISPQVWAWKENRVKTIKQCVDTMLVILPFEVEFYKKWHFEVTYTGHPLVAVIQQEKEKIITKPIAEKPLIALLPCSRAQEINVKLPIMLSVVAYFPEYQFVVAQAPSVPDELLHQIIGKHNVLLAKDDTYNLLKQATAGLITSGTATLETALFGLPQVVCYKGNPVSYWLATKLVKVKYISLVNLIMDKLVVKELIQNDLNTANLVAALNDIIKPGMMRQKIIADYQKLWGILGAKPASKIAAEKVIALAKP
ncbi:MAG: lipid-A-disaccharide synthase [Chitinophagaceae bacterium]|nr:lipid-A-disaccharide synthase [Chitinophagaceae bacterium]